MRDEVIHRLRYVWFPKQSELGTRYQTNSCMWDSSTAALAGDEVGTMKERRVLLPLPMRITYSCSSCRQRGRDPAPCLVCA